MSIVFGTDAGVNNNSLSNFWSEISSEAARITGGRIGSIKGANGLPPKESVYVDDGFMNVPGTAFPGSGIDNIDDAKRRRVTNQRPEVTVYIKKKVFWSLRNEHDIKFMGTGEKLFIRASKLLFERKCAQIAAYESMTKTSSLIDEEADYDADTIDSIVNSYENAKNALDAEIGAVLPVDVTLANALQRELDKLKESDEAVNTLKEIAKASRILKSSTTTNWVINPQANVDITNTGRGVGVIELTLVDTVRTSLGIEHNNNGSISMSVEDPYNLMKITEGDIELALRSAYREMNDTSFDPTISAQGYLDDAKRKDAQLKRIRSNRAANSGFGATVFSEARGNSISRDLGEISFEINLSSSSNQYVVGRISTISEPFNKNNVNIVLSGLPVEQRLTPEELALVNTIFDLLDKYVVEIKKISETNKIDNSDTNIKYARKQLRVFYVGKNIIQPMDGIHVFMRSRTFKDSEALGPLSNFLNGSGFVRSFATNADASDAVLAEEMHQFGLDNMGISVDLYRSIRSDSLLRNAGTHVFGGLVSTVSESYNAEGGKYTLNVSGESNMKWLTLSQVNTTPSLDQPQGVLQDPLTPLDIETDPATGTIIGIPSLSAENKAKSLIYDSGIFNGEQLDDVNINQDIVTFGDRAYPKGKHAPGLVYRWKQGVITATRNINLRTALDGGGSEISKLRRDVGVNVTTNPFANLDVADVVSLMVTGFPHNYESFLLNSQSIGSFVPGGITNSPESYFHSFFDITRSTNRTFGNFQPFKDFKISRKEMADRLKLHTDINNDNETVRGLQSEIAKNLDLLNIQEQYIQEGTDNPSVLSTRNSIKALLDAQKKKLEDAQRELTEKINDGKERGLRIYGDDIILETTDTGESQSKEVDNASRRLKTRSKLMQIRSQLKTKLNADNNLFIVSDDYDKDLDLQAFAISLASSEVPIWNSTYKTPKEVCINASKVIDFEFFCDSFGNIQFRPPQYNKVPLSLLVKMMLLSKDGAEVFPPFLKSLFTSRQKSLETSLEITKKEIEINSLLLFGEKRSAQELFGSVNDGGTSRTSDLFLQSPPDTSRTESEDLGLVETIRNARNDLANLSGTLSVPDSEESSRNIAKEIDELQNPQSKNINSKRLEKTNRLLQLSAEQQRIEETIGKLNSRSVNEQNFIEKLQENKRDIGKVINTDDMESLLGAFGYLIEDDYNDFLGPGSAQRFIIYDDQILDYKFDESDSNVYCRVDVTGQEDLLGGTPGEVGGIPMMWAGATDFDLWKQYGYRPAESVNKPFFKDAENQCAPYALMLLSRQKRDVVRASITVAGNEYYQLGDVVYINSRDMLYYVYSVSQNFSYSSGRYTTQLDLRYGHPLGEFIPTPLDVIGKNLIKNQRKFNTTFLTRKTASHDIGRLAGTILFKNNEDMSVEDLEKQMLTGDIGYINLSELKRSLLSINSQLNRGAFKVDVRGYIIEESESDIVKKRIEVVQKWLKEPISGYSDDGEKTIPLDQQIYKPIQTSNIIKIGDNDPININFDQLTEYNKKNKRLPREETRTINENASGVIEIVILFKEPTDG